LPISLLKNSEISARRKKILVRTLFDEEIKIAKPGSLINSMR
jgi:hypothetical protein